MAEFWEDSGGTAFPPGHWMEFCQLLSEQNNYSLDDYVVLFFALGNAVMDAGIATWEAKRYYDYTCPVRAIRELGRLGLIGTDDGTGTFVIEAWGGVALFCHSPNSNSNKSKRLPRKKQGLKLIHGMN